MSDEAGTHAAEPEAKEPVMSRLELVRRVQAATGAKLKDVQAIVRATLEVMGTALRAGERLNVPPLGAVRVMQKGGADKPGFLRVALREIAEKERPAAADRPAGAMAAKAGGKQGLAAKSEAE